MAAASCRGVLRGTAEMGVGVADPLADRAYGVLSVDRKRPVANKRE